MAVRTRRSSFLVATVAGLVVAGVAVLPLAHATQDVTTQRFAGADRYATAAKVATAAYPNGAGEVVVASGEGYPDALAASFLAGYVAGPILLVTRTTVPTATADALKTLKATKVWIVGGEAAVTKAVADELARDYSVQRIAGADRYATAAAVKNSQLPATWGRYKNEVTAVVASGENFPDALAGGPLAFARKFPLLLTTRDYPMPKATEDQGFNGIQHAIVLGGASAVSDEVVAQIESKGISVERIYGDDRYDTGARVGEFALANLGFKNTDVTLASGLAYPDALSGAAYAGKNQFPVLLMASGGVPATTSGFVQNHNSTINRLTAFGGTTAISDDDLQALKATATCEPSGAPTSLPIATTLPGGGSTTSTSVPACSTPTTAAPTTTTSTTSTSSTSTTSTTVPVSTTVTTSAPVVGGILPNL